MGVHGRGVQRGFSLIELLVVVLLIALTASLVVLNFERDDARVVEREAMRVGALLNQMRDESILVGRPLALELTDQGAGYRFLRFDKDWQPLADSDVFRPRRLPSGMALQFAGADAGTARIVTSAAGNLQAFELTLSGATARMRVRLDDEGVIVVSPDPA